MASFRSSLLHVLNANMLVVMSNALLVFGLPFVIGAEDYGYWQLYQLYALLLGYVTFGITDGLYVRFAGRNWQDLPHRRIASQFWILLGLLVMLTAVPLVILVALEALESPQGVVVVVSLTANLFFTPRTLISIVLQAANSMKLYGRITVLERLLVMVLTVGSVLLGQSDFVSLILLDLAAKILALLVAIFLVPGIVMRKLAKPRLLYLDSLHHIRIGLPVLFANLSIIAIPSVARLVIEDQWSIALFGAISIGFNLSNTLLVLVNSMAISLFPILRQIAPNKLSDFYGSLKGVVDIVLAVSLVFSFPVIWIATTILPDYATGIAYLPILLAVFVFDSTMRLLGANWLKSLREERALLKVNLVCTLAGVVLIALAGYVIQSVAGVLFALLIVVVLRASWAERLVSRRLERRVVPSELLFLPAMIIAFLVTSGLNSLTGASVYLLVLGIVVILRRGPIRRDLETTRGSLSRS